jgi:hypothetical protein
VTVVETAMVPKTRVVESGLRVPLEPEELEPIGQRIVELPKFPSRSLALDPHAPFIAYVPMGSLRRGRAFVSSGGAVMRGTDRRRSRENTAMHPVPRHQPERDGACARH